MKMSNTFLKTLQLLCLLSVSLPFQVSAQGYVVVCFQNFDNQVILTPKDYTVDLLNFTGIKSGQDCIQVGSLTYGAEQTLDIGGQSSGAGAGKIAFTRLELTKSVDSLSPQLFVQMASGKAFKSVNIFFFKQVGSNGEYTAAMTIQLGLAAIANMQTSLEGEAGLSNAEKISLEYGEIKTTVYKFDDTGKKTKGPVGGWNRVKNTATFDNVAGDLNPM